MEASEQLFADRQDEYTEMEADARAAYENVEAGRARRHEQEESLRARLQAAFVNEDVENVATALEVELSNEDLPLSRDVQH